MALSLLNKVVMNRMKWLSNNFKAMGDKVYPEIWCSGLIKPVIYLKKGDRKILATTEETLHK